MATTTYDCVIIGGGHNGLVCAAYLAAGGKKVCVLERRGMVGGTCITEEPIPGFKMSTTAYVVSLLQEHIIRDMELKKHGYQVLVRDPSSFAGFDDGRFLTFYADQDKTKREIGKFSAKDAATWDKYNESLERLAKFIEPLLAATPPDPFTNDPFKLLGTAVTASKGLKLSPEDRARNVEIMIRSCADFLDDWFESDQLKAVLATDGVIGAFAGPRTPGTAYVLLHHVMGSVDGRRGVWGYVKGGMGSLTQAMARCCEARGVTIKTNAEVTRIEVDKGRVRGVRLADGTLVEAKQVLSGVAPNLTFLRMLERDQLPADFLASVEKIRYRSAIFKLNLALSDLPTFTHLPAGANPRDYLSGTIHFCSTMEEMERAYDEAKYGVPSKRPLVEMCLPSLLDDSIAPPGAHVASLFCQYAPFERADGPWDEAKKDAFIDSILDVVEGNAPDIRSKIVGRHAYSPADLESEFGMTGGNLFHGEMTVDRLFSMRPVPGHSGYRTPIKGLYICGSAAHPGGGVMGLPGHNAAKVALKD